MADDNSLIPQTPTSNALNADEQARPSEPVYVSDNNGYGLMMGIKGNPHPDEIAEILKKAKKQGIPSAIMPDSAKVMDAQIRDYTKQEKEGLAEELKSAPKGTPKFNLIQQQLGAQEQRRVAKLPPAEGMLKSGLRAALTDLVPSLGTMAGGIGGGVAAGVAGLELGPFDLPVAIAGSLAGGTAGGKAFGKAQEWALKNIYGEDGYQKLQDQMESDRRAHEMVTGIGSMIGGIPAMFSGKGVAGAVGKTLPKLGKASPLAANIVAKLAEGTTGFATMDASGAAQRGEGMTDIAKAAGKGAVTGAALAYVPHAKGLLMSITARPLSEAAIMAVAHSLYDAAVDGKKIDPLEVGKQALKDYPAFALMGGGSHLIGKIKGTNSMFSDHIFSFLREFLGKKLCTHRIFDVGTVRKMSFGILYIVLVIFFKKLIIS